MSHSSELHEIINQTKKILDSEMNSGVEFKRSEETVADEEVIETLEASIPDIPHIPDTPATPDNTDAAKAPENLSELQEHIGDCRRCKLCSGRKNIVFGEGSERARIMFIGEGPGVDEDIQGRPFVGAAGKLLTDIIEKGIKIKREEVYICNVVKCHPPGNRDPEKNEVKACIPFLKKQIEIIKPEVICTLGRIAARELLERDFKITMERGRWQTYLNVPLMPTYHPAYILRNPGKERKLKGEVWQDIQKIMALLDIKL
jgi:uracil-DNA glycosylase family 4